jgi:CheY-like chemotaxis protein
MPDNQRHDPAIGNRSDVMRQSLLETERRDLEEVVRCGDAPRMLIADDDSSVVRLLADHCARMGFDIETASNGTQALMEANRTRPDILVIDVNMPEVDGLAVCAELLEADRRPLKMIVMTGGKNPDAAERCEKFGAYYARKGPDFWNDLQTALAEIHPGMADRILQSAIAKTANPIRPRPRVLLVDDDNDVNRFIASRLDNRGIDVAYALSARQALRIAVRDEPVVIVTDYFMPNGDAHYLLTQLRSSEATSNIPVIVLSGRKLGEATVKSLRRDICGRPGAAQVVAKSEDPSPLFDALEKYCCFEPRGTDTANRPDIARH